MQWGSLDCVLARSPKQMLQLNYLFNIFTLVLKNDFAGYCSYTNIVSVVAMRLRKLNTSVHKHEQSNSKEDFVVVFIKLLTTSNRFRAIKELCYSQL